MHLFECEATLEACPAAVWAVWTDVARWPEWDVSKEIARLDGPFEPGVSGWAKQRGNLGGTFTITAVEPGRRWVSECPLPFGKVVFGHSLEPLAKDRVRVFKTVEVEGGIAPLIRLFAPKMRREICESLAALGRVAATTPLAGLSGESATPRSSGIAMIMMGAWLAQPARVTVRLTARWLLFAAQDQPAAITGTAGRRLATMPAP